MAATYLFLRLWCESCQAYTNHEVAPRPHETYHLRCPECDSTIGELEKRPSQARVR